MQSQEQKLEIMLKAINEYAERQRLRILYEIDEQSTTELERAEKEALSDAYRMIRQETADVRGSITRDLSSRELAGRRRLLELRSDIERRVFARAEEQLKEFASGDKYEAYLVKAAKQTAEAFSSARDGAVFSLRQCDMKYSESIAAAYGGQCEFESDADIRLGGFIARSTRLGAAVDATLDTRLEDQHEWFGENAGLSIN